MRVQKLPAFRIRYLLAIVFSDESDERIEHLHDLMREEQLEADVSCFWHGEPGAQPPVVAEDVRAALARVPAEIETDFHTD